MIAFRDPMFDAQFLRTLGHEAYGGAASGECFAAGATIVVGDRESWRREWTNLADRCFAAADASARGGHGVSARGAFLRASNYYRNAYIFHLEAPLPAATLASYRRHRQAFARAVAAWPGDGTPEPMAIALDDASMPAWFFPAANERRPVVISVGGYDSTAEESYFWNAAAAVARGYHTVTFDGPGQGAMLFEQGIPFRPDWDTAVSRVIDAIAIRPDVDPDRIVVIGESFGGHLAPRAAARDRRIAACVLDPAQLGLFRAIAARLPLPASLKRDLPYGPPWLIAVLRHRVAAMAKDRTKGWALRRGMLTHGVATPWDYFVDAARYGGEELIAEIRCPTLVCDAEDDAVSAFACAFLERLTCEKGYLCFTRAEGAGEHCVSGNRPLFHERVFDWLDERVGVVAGRKSKGPSPSKTFG